MKKCLIIALAFTVVGFATFAMADTGGYGYNGMGRGMHGMGYGMYGSGSGAYGSGSGGYGMYGSGSGGYGMYGSGSDTSGTGYGNGGMGHGMFGMGYGPSGMGFGMDAMGYGYMLGNLDEETMRLLYEERETFFETTGELSQQIYEKRLELNAELAKEHPNADTAAALQKNVSDLQSQLDQEYIAHILRMKAINPTQGLYYQDPKE